MTEIQWTDEAVDAALAEWLPRKHAHYHIPALRGAMIDALNATYANAAVTVWDEVRDEHARLDDGRPDILDQAPFFAVEPDRSDAKRRAAMRAAIAAARDVQDKTE